MIYKFIKILILLLVILFFFTVFNYYFSEKNISLVKNNRTNLNARILNNISKLPILINNTKDVIEFNSGFESSSKQNFKRNFWELFKKND